mmetsp:Transcript_9375/g.12148  ORF Transcript_9375/g.12148 Transcript_9375/m.12148 type:complete len:298 (-) Transcript_9375:37-930(-)
MSALSNSCVVLSVGSISRFNAMLLNPALDPGVWLLFGRFVSRRCRPARSRRSSSHFSPSWDQTARRRSTSISSSGMKLSMMSSCSRIVRSISRTVSRMSSFSSWHSSRTSWISWVAAWYLFHSFFSFFVLISTSSWMLEYCSSMARASSAFRASSRSIWSCSCFLSSFSCCASRSSASCFCARSTILPPCMSLACIAFSFCFSAIFFSISCSFSFCSAISFSCSFLRSSAVCWCWLISCFMSEAACARSSCFSFRARSSISSCAALSSSADAPTLTSTVFSMYTFFSTSTSTIFSTS